MKAETQNLVRYAAEIEDLRRKIARLALDVTTEIECLPRPRTPSEQAAFVEVQDDLGEALRKIVLSAEDLKPRLRRLEEEGSMARFRLGFLPV